MGANMVVEVTNLQMTYQVGNTAVTVLDIPHWRVEDGMQIALHGSSGCGKSTLLHLLAGLVLPTQGTVRVCGEDLTQLSEVARDAIRAQAVSIIFQQFNLMQGYTALENVLLGMTFGPHAVDRTHANDLLDLVGLTHRRQHYPRQLSIGEQQRVAIARALARRPALLLADEPTGSLDPRHTDEVVRLLQQVCAQCGCALVLVSHDTRVVQAFSHQVAFLDLNRAFAPAGGVA